MHCWSAIRALCGLLGFISVLLGMAWAACPLSEHKVSHKYHKQPPAGGIIRHKSPLTPVTFSAIFIIFTFIQTNNVTPGLKGVLDTVLALWALNTSLVLCVVHYVYIYVFWQTCIYISVITVSHVCRSSFIRDVRGSSWPCHGSQPPLLQGRWHQDLWQRAGVTHRWGKKTRLFGLYVSI